MKSIVTLFVLLLSLSAFAGASSVKMILDQNEVLNLEERLNGKGYALSKIVDVYATKGVYPRCPCNSLVLTFTRVKDGKAEEKYYSVRSEGFGVNIKVTIEAKAI